MNIINRKKINNVVFEIVMFLLSAFVLIPLLMLIFGSLKSPVEAAKFNLLPPDEWQFENYSYVFQAGKLGRAIINSLIYTVFGVGICSVCAMLCAFIIERRNTRITEMVYTYINIGMVAPLMIIPTITLLKGMHIYGSRRGVILVFAGMYIPWSTFLFAGFIKSVPKELDEAAFIDGCKPWKVFAVVVAPLMKPIIATNVVFICMNIWNDMMSPLYLVTRPEMTPVSLSVYQFYGSYFRDWNLVFADLVIASVPVILLYFYLQKYIISGLTVGAVKG